jgi:hypothetical protein
MLENSNQNLPKEQSKPKTKLRTDNLRVRKETKKLILSELSKLNKKEFGRPISPDQYVSLAISLLKPEHLQQLQEESLTAKDRFEQKYRKHCETVGRISKDEFLALLLK